MEDSAIIDLYWAREERALSETDTKYGGYCRSIAFNILHSHEDTEECVSDTWLHTWNAMPPQRPIRFATATGPAFVSNTPQPCPGRLGARFAGRRI